ncbi:hypothetical protein ACET8D_04615 [Aeromonas veronii]
MKKKNESNLVRWRWLKNHLKQVRKSPMPDEPKTNITNFLTTTFSAIPLITAAIYLSGMAYHYGECLVHGLDIVEFPWPADITISMGYLQLLEGLHAYLWHILSIFFSSLTLIIILFFNVRLRLRWAWFCHSLKSKTLLKIRRHLRMTSHVPAPKLFFALSWLKFFYDRFSILTVPLLIALLPALFSFKQGTDKAEQRIKNLENVQWDFNLNHTTPPILGNAPHIRLMCNTTYCAYLLQGNIVKLVRHDKIEEVQWSASNKLAPSNN